MGSSVETTVKALVEFESALERARAEAHEVRKKMIKDAEDLAESAKSGAIMKAQQQASERLAEARAEAEGEAESIRRTGESDLKGFEAAVSKRKEAATENVVSRLLGETR